LCRKVAVVRCVRSSVVSGLAMLALIIGSAGVDPACAAGREASPPGSGSQQQSQSINLPAADVLNAGHIAGETRHRAAGVQVAAVFGDDDRVVLPNRYNNLRHVVGLLFNVRARMVCTAFCVGEDLIATAAHCLYKTRGEATPALEDFQFSRFADTDKKPTKLAGADTKMSPQFVVAGSERLSIRPPIDATSDWAVARLARPLCSQGHLAINPMSPEAIIAASERGQLYQVAFHRDVPNWQLAYSTPCTAGREFGSNSWSTIAEDFTQPQELILHSCDTGGASSGSPLLVDGASGPEVVGINVGTYVVTQQAVKDGVVVKRFKSENVANTAVAARAIVAKLETLRSAVIVQAGGPMQAMQGQLRELQYYNGPLDGRYGPEVKRAIEQFETAARLPVTGLPTRSLMRRLSDETLVSFGETSSITTSSITPVKRRADGRGPTASQRRLNASTVP
jgi:Putative peptidoglycan binding domain/Trypsin-like peptidase domain